MSLLLLLSQAGGSSTRTLEPTKGRLAASGYAPTIDQSGGVAIAPSVGHVVLTGKQVTVSQSVAFSASPSVGHALLTGKQPSVLRSVSVAPATGHIVITGKQAAIGQSSTVTIVPTVGHEVLSGKQPVVFQLVSTTIVPGAGHTAASGHTPVVTRTANQAIAPASGRAAAAGYSPVIFQTVKIGSEDLVRIREIWARMELDASNPVVISPTTLVVGSVTQTINSDGASRTGPLMPAGATPAGTMIQEVWQRLGLDPANPVVQTKTLISSGAIAMAVSELAGTLTVARNA